MNPNSKSKDNYDRLKYDPTETHNRFVNDTIERFKKQKMMKEKVAEGLKKKTREQQNSICDRKLHKRGSPGRPVVSSVNCHTSNILKYVDYNLQPTVKEMPSHAKDKRFYSKT